MKWFDGALIEDDVAVAAGVIFAPFETMGATGFLLPLWSLHEARLVAALQRIGHSLPVPSDLLAIAADLLARNGHRDGVVRLSWCSLRVTGGWLLTTRTRSLQNSVSLLPCVVRRPPATVTGHQMFAAHGLRRGAFRSARWRCRRWHRARQRWRVVGNRAGQPLVAARWQLGDTAARWPRVARYSARDHARTRSVAWTPRRCARLRPQRSASCEGDDS